MRSKHMRSNTGGVRLLLVAWRSKIKERSANGIRDKHGSKCALGRGGGRQAGLDSSNKPRAATDNSGIWTSSAKK